TSLYRRCHPMLYLHAMLYIAMTLASFGQENSGFGWNKKSTLSTDQQVEFPGIVLEPGVYIVKLREGGEKRSTVEIYNETETQVLATIAAVPDHRLRPEDNSEFTYHEIKNGGPRPVQSWFYTGDLVGYEFVYPKARAREIAKESGAYVMASNSIKD